MKHKYLGAVLAVILGDIILFFLDVFDPTDAMSYILYFVVPVIVVLLSNYKTNKSPR
ncbi:hypothetical protein [Erysipelothrix anatis]|uniref:hypothetical protein n=1 Tax=Erysipelothrix anatis TaxID=2683713 RepID=UPI001356E442|nr:hypothetical protein [Erysipelothrix anatis]